MAKKQMPQPGTGPRALKRGEGGPQGYTTYAATGLHPRRLAQIKKAVRSVHALLRQEKACGL